MKSWIVKIAINVVAELIYAWASKRGKYWADDFLNVVDEIKTHHNWK